MYDADIREPLFDYLDEIYIKNRIFEEKIMGRSRADLVMIVEQGFIGLEIKSDADTYERLKTQTRDYDKFCDFNYIVAGQSHKKHVAEHVPDWWGILIVSEENGKILIHLEREAQKNLKCRLEQQIQWLWRTELNSILEKNSLPKYTGKSKKFVQDKLLEKINPQILKGQMVEELFERDYEEWLKSYAEYRKAKNLPVKKRRKKRRYYYWK